MSGMSRADRAKQFMPFAALKGFEEALEAAAKPIYDRVILGEDAQQELDAALRALRVGDEIRLTYYEETKYISRTGRVDRIDKNRKLLFLSGLPVPIEDIIALTAIPYSF